MNKTQFKTVRLQLGMSVHSFAVMIGLRKGTVMRLENGVDPFNGTPATKRTKLNHLMSFACAWILFNGGAFIPWPRSQDAVHFRAFREFHGMTNDEMAALFEVSTREMDYIMSVTENRSPPKYLVLALCWMRVFGSRDPFAFPLHEQYNEQSVSSCPMRLGAAITIEGRLDQSQIS